MIFILFIILNVFIVYKFTLIKKIINIYDYPDRKRKFHKNPIFIGGGIIIFINYFFLLCLIFFDKNYESFFLAKDSFHVSTWILGPLLIFFLGIYDDKKNLNGNLKFIILSIIYLIIIFLDENLIINNLSFLSISFSLDLGLYSLLFTYLCFMIFSNAFNMLDGINLQAGLYSVIVFIFLISRIGFYYDFLIIILSLFTYLYLNFKNKTFLGDSGTYLVSYFLSVIVIKSYNSGKLILCDEILMLMILPGLELVRLFITRILKRQNPLLPDRNHIHHLVTLKFKNISHIKISLINNSLFLFFCLLFFLNPSIFIIIISIMFYFYAIYHLKKID